MLGTFISGERFFFFQKDKKVLSETGTGRVGMKKRVSIEERLDSSDSHYCRKDDKSCSETYRRNGRMAGSRPGRASLKGMKSIMTDCGLGGNHLRLLDCHASESWSSGSCKDQKVGGDKSEALLRNLRMSDGSYLELDDFLA